MKRLLLIPAAALLSFNACERSPTNDGGAVVLVQVMPDERTLAVGETLVLELTARNEGGEEPGNVDEVVWTTSNAGVATVSTGGTVTGVAPGQATIRAELDGVADDVVVTVATAPAACGAGGTLRSLEVGGSVTLNGVEAANVCLSGGTVGSEYVAVPFHADSADAAFTTVRLGAQGVVQVAATSPSVSPALLQQPRRQNDAFHERLRERAELELARHVAAAIASGRGGGLRPSQALNLRNPTVGQQVQVNVSSDSACSNPDMRTGRVAAVGSKSIVLADIANPSGGLTDGEYASFAAGFDTLVYPAITQAFGVPTDVDQNGRVVIFYTRAVNELTPSGNGGSFVGGFFHPRDLFPTRARDGLSACAASNVAEMFYMLVPDPSGQVNGNVFTRTQVLQSSLGTIGHEFQHLINAGHRLYVVGTGDWNEDTWLNEGLSHIAEEILFYRASGLGPRQNVRSSQVQGSARVSTAFATHMDQNLRRYQQFLLDTENEAPYELNNNDANDLATRGAAWAFLRYAADRRAGDDLALWRAMVDGSTTGLDNLQRVLGMDPRPWIRDWTVSVFTDDLVATDARFQQPSWNFRAFPNFLLDTRRLPGPGTTDIPLKSGSGAFVRFAVLPAGVASITARNNSNQPLPSDVYLTIVRTK